MITIRDLVPGATYAMQFRSRRGEDVSPWSDLKTFTVSQDVLAPAEVTGLTVTNSGTSFKASWNPVTQNTDGSDLVDFEDYALIVTNGSETQAVFTKSTFFEFSFELNRATFGSPADRVGFAVVARDSSLNTVPFPAFVYAQNPVPGAPNNLQAINVADGVALKWDAPSDNDISRYRIYANGALVGQTTDTQHIHTNKNYNVNSTYTVRTVDVFNQTSVASNSVVGASIQAGLDTVAPAAPVWSNVPVTHTVRYNGKTPIVEATFNWNDNQETDLAGYVLRYKPSSSTVWREQRSTVSQLTVDNLAINVLYNAELAAYDKSNNVSAFTSTPSITFADTTPPARPSAPGLFSRLGNVTVIWDGKTSTGAGQEPDFSHVNVIDDTTGRVFGRLNGAGTLMISDLDYNKNYYFCLRAYDIFGNESTKSGVESIIIKPLVDTDVIGKIIDGASLIDGSIDAASKVMVGSIETSKLAVGQTNLIVDSAFANPALRSVRSGAGISFGNTEGPKDGHWYARLTGNADLHTNTSSELYAIPVVPGQTYYFAAWAKKSADFATTGGVRPTIRVRLADGTSAYNTIPGFGYFTPTTEWQLYSWEYVAGPNDIFVQPAIQLVGSTAGAIFVSLIDFRAKIGGVLIQDGSITAPKVAALAISADKLAANSVTAPKIAAGAISADKIAIGAVGPNQVAGIGANKISDPGFEDAAYWNAIFAGQVEGIPVPSNGQQPASIANTGAKAGGRVLTTGTAGTTADSNFYIMKRTPVPTSRRIYNGAWCKSSGTSVGIHDQARVALGIEWVHADGSTTSNLTVLGLIGRGFAWTYSDRILDVPETAVQYRAFIARRDFTPGQQMSYHIDEINVSESIGTAPGGQHISITPSGIRLFDIEGTEVISLTSTPPNYLNINRLGASGESAETVASINENGDISGQVIDSSAELRWRGINLITEEDYARNANFGQAAWQSQNSVTAGMGWGLLGYAAYGAANGPTTNNTSGVGWFEMEVEAVRGRLYRVECGPMRYSATGDTSRVQVVTALTHTFDGSSPTIANAVLASTASSVYKSTSPGTRMESAAFSAIVRPPGTTVGETSRMRILLKYALIYPQNVGVAEVFAIGDDSLGVKGLVSVYDIGPDRSNLVQISAGGGGSASSPTPPPATRPPRSYTKRYYATWSGTYRAAGYHSNTGNEMKQGTFGSIVNIGMMGFNDAQIRSDLNGATVRSCRMYAYSNHWYNNSGGTAIIGTSDYSGGRPGTLPPGIRNRVTPNFPKPGGRLVELGTGIGNEFRVGSTRSITFGDGRGGTQFYGSFNGVGMANPPWIEITYEK